MTRLWHNWEYMWKIAPIFPEKKDVTHLYDKDFPHCQRAIITKRGEEIYLFWLDEDGPFFSTLTEYGEGDTSYTTSEDEEPNFEMFPEEFMECTL